MTTAALILGIIGAITGALSLGWNIAAHFLTAGRAKVTLRGAWIHGGTYASIPVTTFDSSTPPMPGAEAALLVEISNVGRLPVTVTECSVGIGPTIAYGELNAVRNPRIPHRLDVGDIGRWVFGLSDVLEVVELARTQGQQDLTLSGRASVGAGGVQHSKERVDPQLLRA